MLYKKSGQIPFLFLIYFLVACASTGEFDERTSKKKRKRQKAIATHSLRVPASDKAELFFDNSGLDFLSKKLEDTISGYEGLQNKISGLEERLKRLIFLLEGKVKTVVERKPKPKEELLKPIEEDKSEKSIDKSLPGEELVPAENEDVMENEPQQAVPDLPAENVISSGE